MTGERPVVGVVDYGAGNRRSVEKALARAGAEVRLTGDHDALRACDALVVPGVGAFAACAEALRDRGHDELVGERASAGVPLLGICVGMQLLFEESTELGGGEGLGLLAGRVDRLEVRGERLPHIGWSVVSWKRPSPLSERLDGATAFYHVHSYAARPRDAEDVLATAAYGAPFVTAVGRDNVLGVQFHAEKSSVHGLALLRGWIDACARVAAP